MYITNEPTTSKGVPKIQKRKIPNNILVLREKEMSQITIPKYGIRLPRREYLTRRSSRIYNGKSISKIDRHGIKQKDVPVADNR